MRKLRKVVSSALATLAVAGSAAVVGLAGPLPTANATVGIDMNLACQYTAGYTSYRGVLMYPSQGALGWRCVDRAGIRPTMSANLWGYCVNVWGYSGAYTNNPSNPYSWYCG